MDKYYYRDAYLYSEITGYSQYMEINQENIFKFCFKIIFILVLPFIIFKHVGSNCINAIVNVCWLIIYQLCEKHEYYYGICSTECCTMYFTGGVPP